ncbi:TfoX/Sxy family DNA transformation protein [Chitinibacter sp. FCG-7]|uniref:TfoX/Sxy family DNA transformation protein n=1 Tax=Chitinibacter mangrovi TaxID=3153927 RepID=A0AAU7F885_9NEIS
MEITNLKGLGPKSQQMLAQIGIENAAQLLAADPFELYAQLRRQQAGVSLNLLYAMIGAQENCAWQQIKRDRKTEILLRLDEMGCAPD